MHVPSLALACALLVSPAWAQEVSLHGMLGNKALLVVDGSAPRALAVGQRWHGVELLSAGDDQAVVRVGGQDQVLYLGHTPVHVQGQQPDARGHLALYANTAGHFMTAGSINDRPVQFMVDTGASFVSLGQDEAERLKLDWRRGRPVRMHTANGEASGRLIQLERVRVGEMTAYGVDAVVTPVGMPLVLLGNSFLNRFDMQRSGSQMLLSGR